MKSIYKYVYVSDEKDKIEQKFVIKYEDQTNAESKSHFPPFLHK